LPANFTKAIKSCLLVDDDEDDQEIFCLALHEADASVNCRMASDGKEALKILSDKSYLPDYIFLDLNMPQMNGKECLKEIRKRDHLNQIPVVIFTTSSAEREIAETRRLGANFFITKPPLVSVLAAKLSEIFNDTHRLV
jgi:CheY-like chemotaxis protein